MRYAAEGAYADSAPISTDDSERFWTMRRAVAATVTLTAAALIIAACGNKDPLGQSPKNYDKPIILEPVIPAYGSMPAPDLPPIAEVNGSIF